MSKWWRHSTHPDTVRRLEAVTLRLEEATQDFRERLEQVVPGSTVKGTVDVGDPTRGRESA